MIVTFDQTENFTIEYQDVFADARRRAQALRRSCESEFATLRGWFGVTKGFGPSNRVTLQIETASFASNGGYHEDGTTKVIMNPFDTQHFPAPGEIVVSQADADDAVVALFVAEIVEVLMSYNNTKSSKSLQSWNPGGSDGEGLSRVCAALFHPAGYYGVLRGQGVNPWFQSGTLTTKRVDWIEKTEPTDQDIQLRMFDHFHLLSAHTARIQHGGDHHRGTFTVSNARTDVSCTHRARGRLHGRDTIAR